MTMGDTVETLLRPKVLNHPATINVTLGVVVAILVGAGVYFGVQSYKDNVQRKQQQQQIQSSLAPAAVYINPKLYPERITPKNEDVNGDGNWESVLYFTNPITGKLEQQLIEACGEHICFHPFLVEQGEIVYLDDYCRK